MTSFKGFNFLRLWAKDQRFVYIKSYLEALAKDLKGKDINSQESYQIIYDKLKDTFEDNKRDVVSQHPSGTMEWRGPTGIMDDDKAIDHINDFFRGRNPTFLLCQNPTFELCSYKSQLLY